MAKKKPQPEKPKDVRINHQMVRVPNDLHHVLKTLADRNRRPIAWELRRLLEEAFAAEGLWPPPPEE